MPSNRQASILVSFVLGLEKADAEEARLPGLIGRARRSKLGVGAPVGAAEHRFRSVSAVIYCSQGNQVMRRPPLWLAQELCSNEAML